ncbi:MAG TPA: hypothetical protein VHG71_10490, partial [Verrucomicrobiae bacterium]|nr:hypothetical protein [Verrucomicrobiae bacterium]
VKLLWPICRPKNYRRLNPFRNAKPFSCLRPASPASWSKPSMAGSAAARSNLPTPKPLCPGAFTIAATSSFTSMKTPQKTSLQSGGGRIAGRWQHQFFEVGNTHFNLSETSKKAASFQKHCFSCVSPSISDSFNIF